MLNKKSQLLLAVLAATAATQAPTALSQDSGFVIEEVVVTARSRRAR